MPPPSPSKQADSPISDVGLLFSPQAQQRRRRTLIFVDAANDCLVEKDGDEGVVLRTLSLEDVSRFVVDDDDPTALTISVRADSPAARYKGCAS